MCDADDLSTFLEHDRDLHSLLYGASRRSQFAKRIMDLCDSLRRVYHLPESVEATHTQLASESHEAILMACELGDSEEVDREIREHTDDAARRILPALRHKDDDDGDS